MVTITERISDGGHPDPAQLDAFATALEAHASELVAAGITIDESWVGRARGAVSRLAQRPEVAIAMLGGTGAGKSTW